LTSTVGDSAQPSAQQVHPFLAIVGAGATYCSPDDRYDVDEVADRVFAALHCAEAGGLVDVEATTEGDATCITAEPGQ
jgi:hypothetical protein